MGCGDSKNAAAAAAAMSSSPGFLNIEDVYSGGSAARSSESGTEIQEAFQDGRFVRPEIGFVVKCFLSDNAAGADSSSSSVVVYRKCFINVFHSSAIPDSRQYHSNKPFDFAMPVGGAVAAHSGTSMVGVLRPKEPRKTNMVYVVDIAMNSKALTDCSVDSKYLHETIESIMSYVRDTYPSLGLSLEKKYKLPVIAKGFAGHDKVPRVFLRNGAVNKAVIAPVLSEAAQPHTTNSATIAAPASDITTRVPFGDISSVRTSTADDVKDDNTVLTRRDSYISYQYTPVSVRQLWLLDGSDGEGGPTSVLEYRPVAKDKGLAFLKFYVVKYDRSKIYIVGNIQNQSGLTKLVLFTNEADTVEHEIIAIWLRTLRSKILFPFEDLTSRKEASN